MSTIAGVSPTPNAAANQPLPLQPLLTKRQAADLLGCCPRTIDNLVAAGKLPVVKIGASARFDTDDLRRYIAAQKRLTEAPEQLEPAYA